MPRPVGLPASNFLFLPRHRDTAPRRNGGDGAMAGDDGDVVVTLDLEVISLVGVGFAAARHPRMVWLFEVFEPFFDPRILPLVAAAR